MSAWHCSLAWCEERSKGPGSTMKNLVALASVCWAIGLQQQLVGGHGTVMDPVGRSSAWKRGFKTPVNYDDIELFCGGISVQHAQNGGKCGVCGDDYALPRPRPNENGGKYGTGTIVKRYKAGQRVSARVHIDTNHLGHFEFALCPLDSAGALESEECFARHPLLLADGSRRFRLRGGVRGAVAVELRLPEGLRCEHCVFRWHWRAANNWGVCEDGRGAVGCGPQEHYRSCSDISIE